MKPCLMCGESLNREGECITNNCTELPLYGVIEGANWDEKDIKRISLQKGRCVECGTLIPEDKNKCSTRGCWPD